MGETRERVALVTGASSGIGEAVARRLLSQGWCVAMTARREDRLVTMVKLLDTAGDRTLTLVGDITSPEDRKRWVTRTYERWGRIDTLVNNAGYGQRGPIELVPVDAMRANFETNLFALVALTQLVIPLMRARGHGRIINIGSVAGRIARPFSSVYDATKHALNAVSDGLRGELQPFGIDVVVIQPGFIATEFVAAANKASGEVLDHMGVYNEAWEALQASIGRLKRLAGKPDDIADLVDRALRARRPRARYSGPRHAKLFLAVKWLLPDRVFDAVFRVRRSS